MITGVFKIHEMIRFKIEVWIERSYNYNIINL